MLCKMSVMSFCSIGDQEHYQVKVYLQIYCLTDWQWAIISTCPTMIYNTFCGFCSVSCFVHLWKPCSCTESTGLKTPTLFGVVGYYDLFNSMVVRIQYNQGDIQSMSIRRSQERNTDGRKGLLKKKGLHKGKRTLYQ